MNSAKNAWYHGVSGAVGGDAEAELARLHPHDADDERGADDRADHLGDHVRRDELPRELAGHGEAERDGGVDVVARDVAEHVDRDDDDQGERQRDESEVGAREGRVAADEGQCRHRADADEHEECGSEQLGSQLLPELVLVIHEVLL